MLSTRARHASLFVVASSAWMGPAIGTPQLTFGPLETPRLAATGGPLLADSRAVYPGDFNGDGRADFVTDLLSLDSRLGLVRNVGAGTYAGIELVPLPSWSGSPAVADFNGDGLTDFAVEIYDFRPSDGIIVYFGAPDATTIVGQRIGTPTPDLVIRMSLATIDFDGDGDADLVHLDDQATLRTIYENDGAGGFTAHTPVPFDYLTPVALDFDEDGDEDLLAFGGGVLHWFRSEGDGTFGAAIELGPTSIPVALRARWHRGDLDGDGREDAAIGQFWVQNGPGDTFQLRRDYMTSGDPVFINAVEDLDLDGRDDIVGLRGLEGGYFRSTGGGTFEPFEFIPPAASGGFDYMFHAPIDLDGDCDLDLYFPVVTRFIENVTTLGSQVCGGAVNSTGATAVLEVTGSSRIGVDRTCLSARDLPATTFTLFLTSLTDTAPVQPPGSQGLLCLGGSIARFNRPGEIVQADALGRARLVLDFSDVPDAVATSIQITQPETRFFQAWYRDVAGGTQSSNFTSAVVVNLD